MEVRKYFSTLSWVTKNVFTHFHGIRKNFGIIWICFADNLRYPGITVLTSLEAQTCDSMWLTEPTIVPLCYVYIASPVNAIFTLYADPVLTLLVLGFLVPSGIGEGTMCPQISKPLLNLTPNQIK